VPLDGTDAERRKVWREAEMQQTPIRMQGSAFFVLGHGWAEPKIQPGECVKISVIRGQVHFSPVENQDVTVTLLGQRRFLHTL
jgi:hypothetical protein